jgi:hypothetical protein
VNSKLWGVARKASVVVFKVFRVPDKDSWAIPKPLSATTKGFSSPQKGLGSSTKRFVGLQKYSSQLTKPFLVHDKGLFAPRKLFDVFFA